VQSDARSSVARTVAQHALISKLVVAEFEERQKFPHRRGERMATRSWKVLKRVEVWNDCKSHERRNAGAWLFHCAASC